jgi:hypothetical protein
MMTKANLSIGAVDTAVCARGVLLHTDGAILLKKTGESGIKTQNAVLIIIRQYSRSMPLDKHNCLCNL